MRPPVGGGSSSESPQHRKQSNTSPSPNVISAASTTFFIASESMMDTPTVSMSDTTFGVRSFSEEEPITPVTVHDREESRRRSTIIAPRSLPRDLSKDSLSMGSFGSSSGESSPSRAFERPHIKTTSTTNSKNTLSLQSPILGISEPSSPKSTSMSSSRPSDDEVMDDQSSQAVMSDSEEEGPPAATTTSTNNNSAPQFIMPSIMMPSRRPFSDKGLAIGRLKILLAGASGVGKTSLIKSIVQTCDDVVHIDASIPNNTRLAEFKKSAQKSSTYNKTQLISEAHASTKAYPTWWSDLEESNVLRRRKSGDGTVLERNICFVDTPGYDSGISVLEGMNKVLRYIESQMTKALDIGSADDSEILNLLGGGGGGSQVDVVLYLLSHPIKPADLEFMKQLSVITNVVPLLARVDEIAEDQIDRVKASISEDLMASDLKLFPLGLQAPTNQLYTVCSSPSKDLENMDASLLMQSDYIQPLQASELSTMIEQLFIPDTIRRLKFFAAKKIIQNRRIQQASTIGTSSSRTGPPPSYTRSNTTPSPSDFFKTSSQVLISRTPGILTYNQSAMADHTLREERLARIHLANWASNLQRSLTNERARYEAIAKSERAEWLKARLGECLSVQDIKSTGDDTSLDMTLIPNPIPKPLRDQKQQITNIRGACSLSRGALYDAADPLGLLRWRDELGAHGMLLLKIMGGASIFGAIGTFLYFTIKNWTEASNLHQGQYSFIGEWFGCF